VFDCGVVLLRVDYTVHVLGGCGVQTAASFFSAGNGVFVVDFSMFSILFEDLLFVKEHSFACAT